MPLPIRLWNPLDIFDEPPRKPRRGSTAAYRPSRLYDVPIPPKLKPKVKKEIERRRKERKEELRQRPTSKAGIPIPSRIPGLRAAVGDIGELAAGIIPATKTVARAAKSDLEKLVERQGVRMPTRSTLNQYYDLLKWTVADEKGDKRARPKTQSEIVGLLAAMTRGWGRGIERALPDPFDSEDRAEAKKTWSEDPVFALLDVIPAAALLTRPASIAKHTVDIERKNQISRGRALALGVKESYRPGAARRAGLEGGIAPRTLESDVGSVPGRPWSRTPLIRALQSRYDTLYEPRGRAAETKLGQARLARGRQRVGRTQERLMNEEQRRKRLETDELTEPVSKLVYGRMGRIAGAFGLKKNMTAKERRAATALIYRMQMPRHLNHADALAAVQADLSEILRSGNMELPKGNRVKSARLSEAERQNLAIQIADLDLVRRDLREGKLEGEELDAGLEALSEIAGRTNGIGLDILERRLKLDPDALDEIADGWRRRSQVLPRRLAGRGHLAWRSLEGSEERAAWLDLLTNQLGEEQARTLVVAMDAFARKTRPQDPASWYEDRVGMPTPESAQAFVNRVGDDALFQMEAGVRRIVGSPDLDADPNARVFYSPLQRWVDEDWDKRYQSERVSAQKLRNDVKAQTPEDWWRNGGFEEYFDSFAPGERVTKQEFKEHLSSALNAYNLEEHFFLNIGEPRMNFQQIRHPGDLRTSFDTYKRGAVISRDPGEGEYAELVMRLRADSRFGPYDSPDPNVDIRWGTGMAHWGESNVVAHARFQIFTEDGVTKMLVEEIQSDWTRDARKAPYKEVTAEDRAKAAAMESDVKDLHEEAERLWRETQEVQAKMDELNGERDFLVQQRGEVDGREAADLEGEIDAIDQTWNDLLREYDEVDARQNEASLRAEDAWQEMSALTRGGAPPSPFGAKYYRTVLRRLAREAVEQGADEIIFQDPTSQFLRAADDIDTPMLSSNKAGTEHLSPQPLLDWLLARERLWEDKLARANQRVELEIEQSGTPRAEWDQRDINRLYFDDERHMREQLRDLRNWRSIYGETLPNALRKEYGLDPGEWRRNAYVGRYSQEFNRKHPDGAFSSTGDMPGMVLKVNDRMREQVANAQRLYQRNPDFKGLPRGATELLSDGRTQLHIFSGAGVDTVIHELGHIALHDLHADDLNTITGHFAGGRPVEEWTTAQHENYARTFERYFRKGEAPNPELASVFAKISAWMKEVWAQVKQRQPELPEDVRRVFDGMLPDDGGPTDELETFGYFPHRDLYEIASQEYRGGVRPAAAGQTIGVPRLPRETIERGKNELVLYQGGRLNPDPAALVDVYLKRLRFQETLDARDHLWEIGRPLSERPPKGAWLVRNPDALPERITPEVAGAPRGQELRREPDSNLDEHLSLNLDDFRKDVVELASKNPPWGGDMDNVRWVPGEYVNSRFGQVFDSSPRGSLASIGGLLTSMQRATGIYGRPISYAAGNIPFNVMALLATMPAANLRSAQRMIRMRRTDPELYRRISSESGQARAEAGLPGVSYTRAVNPAQAAERQVTQIQRGMADALSGFSDDPYRVTAFLSNARKRGYSTDAELRALIGTPKQPSSSPSDLSDVRQLTREQLLDFDALNPFQRKLASNLLYLWPFMYAATKWPLMYAREYPGRAGAQAQLIEGEEERLLPLEVANFWKSKGIDLSAINPLGPGGEMVEDLDLLLRDPGSMDLTVLKERLSPSLDLLVESMGGGKKNALTNFVRGTVPGVSEALAFAGEDWRGSKMYADRDRPGPYLGTRHARFWPRELNEAKMQEAIEQAKRDEITTSTIDREKADDKEKINKYLKALGGIDYGEELTRSYQSWWEYQEAVSEKKDSTGQRKLTPVQQVEILDEVVRENFPEYSEELYSLDRVRSAAETAPEAVEEYVKELRAIINDGRDSLFNDYRSHVAE